jgi:hypothetical protein
MRVERNEFRYNRSERTRIFSLNEYFHVVKCSKGVIRVCLQEFALPSLEEMLANLK